jgi:dTDP-4-dehydrorhamnose 3,5-epimerase-like enzyme
MNVRIMGMFNLVKGQVNGVSCMQTRRHRDHRGILVKPLLQDFDIKDVYFSQSNKRTLRGLHYQEGQCKILTCISGSLLDIIVDVRPRSETYLRYQLLELNEGANFSVFIPDGCAHGIYTKKGCTMMIQASDILRPDKERILHYSYIPELKNIIIDNISEKDINKVAI